MTQKIEFDALRYCRNNAGRMGRWRGQDVAGLLAAEVEQLRAGLTAARGKLLARCALLEAELQRYEEEVEVLIDRMGE